jgi:hypothetical protein
LVAKPCEGERKKDAVAESLNRILCLSHRAARLFPSFDGETDHYTNYQTADRARAQTDNEQVGWL